MFQPGRTPEKPMFQLEMSSIRPCIKKGDRPPAPPSPTAPEEEWGGDMANAWSNNDRTNSLRGEGDQVTNTGSLQA